MLKLTENATTVIEALVGRSDLPEGAGLRIASSHDGPDDLDVSAADTPETGDRVIEAKGARIFLEAGAAAALDDKVLDAHSDDQGRVQFMLVAQ
jgi:Fe-S cluster assembly iron-binding protein IscA